MSLVTLCLDGTTFHLRARGTFDGTGGNITSVEAGIVPAAPPVDATHSTDCRDDHGSPGSRNGTGWRLWQWAPPRCPDELGFYTVVAFSYDDCVPSSIALLHHNREVSPWNLSESSINLAPGTVPRLVRHSLLNRNAFWVKVDGRFSRGRSRRAKSFSTSQLRRLCGSSIG